MKKYEISASLICGNPLNLEKEVRAIEASNIEYIHFDVMDGNFVPRYGLYPEIISEIRKITTLPIDVHMMVTDPEPYIQIFKDAGADIYYVHAENNANLHRVIKKINLSGMKTGIVLNMSTPLNVLDYIREDIDYVMLMAINPGIVGHKLIPQTYQKIKDLRNTLDGFDIKIMIDGGVNLESAKKMVEAGADILVCGTSSIFRPHEGTLPETTEVFRKTLE